MATAKKKTTPARKAATAVAQKPRTDYKAGTRVKVTRRDGSESKGFVDRVETKSTGSFVHVNIGSKTEPVMIAARPVNVRGY